MNLQNVPHDALTYFVSDPGYVIYSLDYSQYENRIVAYVGNIPQMIEVFENKLDSHRMTASLVLSLLGKPTLYEEVTNEDRQEYGKIPNHAFNYGLGPNSFAIMHELLPATGKRIHSAYHKAYPGVRGGYWKYVQNCLRENRVLTNLLGRKVEFLGKWSDKLLHEAYSCIPQGSCGDCINERGLIFIYFSSEFEQVELLTQVHDSVDIQIPLILPLKNHAEILIRIKKELEKPLEFKGREFIPPVDLVVNFCLNKELGVELKGEKFSTRPEMLENTLRQAIEKLQGRKERNGK
jgi:DNA polymerase-1